MCAPISCFVFAFLVIMMDDVETAIHGDAKLGDSKPTSESVDGEEGLDINQIPLARIDQVYR